MHLRIKKIISIFIVFFCSFILFGVILELAGFNSLNSIKTLLVGGWGSRQSILESMVKAIPIMMCAIAVAIPGRFGLINLGGEGQLIMGAIGACGAAFVLPDTPHFARLLIMGAAAMISGMMWGLLPGVLRAITGASEIVVSLLLNYVAQLILLYLIHGPWQDPSSFGWAQAPLLGANAKLPLLMGTRLHPIVFVGLMLCGFFYFCNRYTVFGLSSRIIQESPRAAFYAGIPVRLSIIVTFAIGGALAGLAGFGELAAIQGRLREGISLGYGYSGFLASWLCSHNFGLIPLSALLLGSLMAGTDVLRIKVGLPFATINILQGLLFFALLVSISWMEEKE